MKKRGRIAKEMSRKALTRLFRISRLSPLRWTENPWQGGPPTTTVHSPGSKPLQRSTSSDETEEISASRINRPKLCLYVFTAAGSKSTADLNSKSAHFSPRENPPAPQKRSIAVCD